MSGASGYTIEELERASGIRARTIRYYRQEGLLGSPRRVGRRAYYDEEHLERLRLIAGLRERGLGLDAVAKVIEDPQGEHRAFSDLLELGDELLAPWIEDEEVELSSDELRQALGGASSEDLGLLERYGVIEAIVDGGSSPDVLRYRVPSTATLELAAQLRAARVDPEVAYRAWLAMQRHLGALADELVRVFTEHRHQGFERPATTLQVAEAFRRLRRLALAGVQLGLAHEMERAIEAYVEAHGSPWHR